MGPEGKGFPYYSPSKPRTPKTSRGGDDTTTDSSAIEGRCYDNGDDDSQESFVAEAGEGEDGDATPSLYELNVGEDMTPTTAESQQHQQNHRSKLANTNVRRQIIQSWEDKTAGTTTLPSNGSSDRRNGMTRTTPPPGNRGGASSVQTAAEALVAMATPTKGGSLLCDHGRDEEMSISSDDESDVGYKLTETTRRRKSTSVGKGGEVRDDVICNGKGRRSKSRSPPSAESVTVGKVSVDGEGLVRVFDRIVSGTEGCSIVEMERIHTTYQQLVFRHRMSWHRDALLEVSKECHKLPQRKVNVEYILKREQLEQIGVQFSSLTVCLFVCLFVYCLFIVCLCRTYS